MRGNYGAYAHRLDGPVSSRPLSPRPCKAAVPKGPTFFVLISLETPLSLFLVSVSLNTNTKAFPGGACPGGACRPRPSREGIALYTWHAKHTAGHTHRHRRAWVRGLEKHPHHSNRNSHMALGDRRSEMTTAGSAPGCARGGHPRLGLAVRCGDLALSLETLPFCQ